MWRRIYCKWNPLWRYVRNHNRIWFCFFKGITRDQWNSINCRLFFWLEIFFSFHILGKFETFSISQLDNELEISRRWWLTKANPELTIASWKLRASNLIVLVKTNLCSLFLQNYLKKKRTLFSCEKLGLVALLAAKLDIDWRIDSE